jgi:hypothetical protein
MAENGNRNDPSVCTECGATGQTDVFCDSCGAVLRARALGADGDSAPASAAPKPYEEPRERAQPAPQPEPEPLSQIASILGGVAAPAQKAPAAGSAPGDAPVATPQVDPQPQYAPMPVSPPASASVDTPADGWDAAAEWGNVLAPEQEPESHPVVPPPSGPVVLPGAPGTLTPPTRGPYEFTSRRPEAFPPGAAVGPPPTTSPLQVPQALSGFLVSQPADTPAPAASNGALAETTPPLADTRPDGAAADVAQGYHGGPAQNNLGSSALLPYDQAQIAPNAQATPSELEMRARELIVPVADRTPVERIVPVPPGMPEPARPTVRTPQLHEVTGGIPCPWCSTPNPVDRHFCRRCAMSLAAHPGGPKRKRWWRRLVDWRRRPIPFAGQRPRLRHGIGRLLRWTIGFAVLVLVFVEIDLHAANAVMDVEDHFATPTEIHPTSWYGPDSQAQHPVTNLSDAYNTTWWGSSEQGNSQNVKLEATFTQPIDLLDLIITPGAGINPDTFNEQSRPETIKVTLLKTDGSTAQTTVTFNDSVGPETFKVRGNDVSHIVFTIESAYVADGPVATTYVAITQIEFFARSVQQS